jgi:hypothetical protein
MAAFPSGLFRTLATALVNEITQFNNNWDLIDAAFTSLWGDALTNPVVTGPDIGTEWINKLGKLVVWNGTVWEEPRSETWGAWAAITITAPYRATPGNVPQIRKSNLNNVEMRGAIQLNVGSDPFPDTGYILVSSGQFAVGTGYCPEMTTKIPAGMDLTGVGFTNGYIYLTVTGGPSTLAIYILPQGTRAVGNSIKLDNVRYKGA